MRNMEGLKKITIWHTNDVHSRFEKYIQLAAYIKEHADSEKDLILDAGDFADQLSVMVSGTDGLGAMRLLSAAGVDAIAVGNNEFFAGAEKLSAMAGCGVPVLSANLRDLEGGAVPGVRHFIRLERAGVRLLLIGCCPYFTHVSFFTDNAGVKLLEPVAVLSKLIKKEKKDGELCILLSHAGIKRDHEIAEKVSGIDVIIGGHSHTFMEKAEDVCGKVMHQSGCHSQVLGKLDLYLDEYGKIVRFEGENLEVSCDSDPKLSTILKEEEEKGVAKLSEPLFTISRDLSFDPFEECEAVNAVADSLYSEYGGDFAIINNGILTEGFSGEISRMSLLKSAPSILNPTTVWWKGRMVREALAASADSQFIRQDGKGPGFRGDVLGAMAVSRNVRVVFGKGALPEVFVDGEPLDDERTYCVIADDYLYRGISGYTMMHGSEQPEEYHPGYIRDMLERTLRDEGIVAGAAEKRIIKEKKQR